jgi:hypothetical protein
MSAKDIIIKPISSKDANNLCKILHYSGKVVPNSQLHFGVFYKGRLEGVMQYGPSLRKHVTINLVKNTSWNGFIELNRMAFSDNLPRFSESRAIAITIRMIKKNYPHIDWIISFADGCQCGDGAIYRASGFYLTDIRENEGIRTNPKTGEKVHIFQAHHLKMLVEFKKWKPVNGYMLRYVYFINKEKIKDLNCPIIPFEKIGEMGIGMYKGENVQR